MDNGPPGIPPSQATAAFRMPRGWTGIANDRQNHGSERFWMCPAPLVNVSGHPSMEVVFAYLDFTAPYTQEGQAGGYLDAIHHHEDDDVKMERVGDVENMQFGRISTFHFYSAYIGERWNANLIAAPLGLSVELHCKTSTELEECRPAFEALLRSVRVNGAKPSHQDDPRRLERGW